MHSEWKETTRVLLVSAALLICADAHAGSVTLGIGADYASGKYGEPNTTKDLYVPFSVTYKEGAWRTKLVVPFISIEGNGEVVGGREDRVVDDRRGRNSGSGGGGGGGGGGGADDDDDEIENETDDDEAAEDANPTTASQSFRESGLGDVAASITYSAIANEDIGLYLDITVRVKFGTADEDKGLGSGENDYGLHVDIDKDVGNFTLSLGAGYTFIGSPSGFDYRDVVSASTGVSYRFSDAFSVNTFVSYRQAVRAGAPNQLDVAPGLSYRLTDTQRMNAYLLFGLDDGSPDVGAGIAYSYTF